MHTRDDCIALDRADPLGHARDRFVLPQGVNYLDGNSLGARPKSVGTRLQQVLDREWGEGLIRSWSDAGWFHLPLRVGDTLAPLIGAKAGEVAVGDSTSAKAITSGPLPPFILRRTSVNLDNFSWRTSGFSANQGS